MVRYSHRERLPALATGSTNSEKRCAASIAQAREEPTPQELQVATAVAAGATTNEAASSLFLSPKTIQFHLRNAYRKLGVTWRTPLANALRKGEVER